jgi:hypothetical protein
MSVFTDLNSIERDRAVSSFCYLVGLVLAEVVVTSRPWETTVQFATACGRSFVMSSRANPGEVLHFEVSGSLSSLIGVPILKAKVMGGADSVLVDMNPDAEKSFYLAGRNGNVVFCWKLESPGSRDIVVDYEEARALPSAVSVCQP